jgi:hypothetical protein
VKWHSVPIRAIASEDARIGTRQSIGRVGSCVDNALPETPHLKLTKQTPTTLGGAHVRP